MPNLASTFKAEVSRIARKELKAEVEGLRRSSAQYRTDIAKLKRSVVGLERQLARLSKGTAKARSASMDVPPSGKALRFSAERFAAQRKKLGLTAADMAKLLGVSQLSVYKWEHGKARPRQKQLESIAAIRSLGKREATAQLAALDPQP